MFSLKSISRSDSSENYLLNCISDHGSDKPSFSDRISNWFWCEIAEEFFSKSLERVNLPIDNFMNKRQTVREVRHKSSKWNRFELNSDRKRVSELEEEKVSNVTAG